MPQLPAGMESPSLSKPDDGPPAYELKFLLDEERAKEVEAWAKSRLVLDAHGDPAAGGAYRITSLYFDTPDLAVFHRMKGYVRHKFRLRRYGSASDYFLERKTKWGNRVAKRRTPLPEDELSLLANPMSVVTWPGHWFHFQLLSRRLQPTTRISYQRTAYMGMCSEGPMRLTLDRNVVGLIARDWALGPIHAGMSLLTGRVILEFKFRLALPFPFKERLQVMSLDPRGVSKYRLCGEACSLAAPLREVNNA